MEKIVLLGDMGRDDAAASNFVRHGHQVYGIGRWLNPGLVKKCEASGGQYHVIDDIKNVELVANIVQGIEPDIAFTNFDDALAAGFVDAIKRRIADKRMSKLLLPCPDQKAAKVEWDKLDLREIVDKIYPKYNMFGFRIETGSPEAKKAVKVALDYFEQEEIEVALKPRNLTRGKGVWVMGKQLRAYGEDDPEDKRLSAWEYALEVLVDKSQTGLEIQEKLDENCHEFTLQIFTDGTTIIRPPATYDYPYREDGDTGPGTGGMGAFSMAPGEQLPFLTQADYDEAIAVSEKILEELKARGRDFKGVFYPTFFKTPKGLKIVEVNARGGDPELINIIDLMEEDVDLAEVLRQIAQGELTKDSIRFKKLASAMIYLVSPMYGYEKSPPIDFRLYLPYIAANGCGIRFAAAEHVNGNDYRTVGTSRTVGFSALGRTPWDARSKSIHTIANGGVGHPLPLDYRREVARKDYIKNLA